MVRADRRAQPGRLEPREPLALLEGRVRQALRGREERREPPGRLGGPSKAREGLRALLVLKALEASAALQVLRVREACQGSLDTPPLPVRFYR
jgi:hypothetical protein